MVAEYFVFNLQCILYISLIFVDKAISGAVRTIRVLHAKKPSLVTQYVVACIMRPISAGLLKS